MQIHLWRGDQEPTELLMTPGEQCDAAPPPSTGGRWVYVRAETRTRHSTEPLPAGVSWEEISAAFSFTGYWTGAGELDEAP